MMRLCQLQAKKRKNENMSSGNIYRRLMEAAVPLLIGDILQQLYNMTDTIIIGRFLGSQAFAAAGISSTVMNLFTFIIAGFCTGISIVFANAYGQADFSTFRKETYLTIVPGGMLAMFFGLTGLMLVRPILQLLQTPVELLNYAQDYLTVILAGMPAVYFYNLGAALLRSVGKFSTALMFLIGAVSFNIVADCFLIEVFQWGIRGAAIATVASQTVSAAGCFFYIKKNYSYLLFGKKECVIQKSLVKKTLSYGLVSALHQSSLYLGKAMVQRSVNEIGIYAVSAFTASTRIEDFVNAFGSSMSQSVSIFTAQNYGAGSLIRVKNGVRSGMIITVLLSLFSSVVLFFGAGLLMQLVLAVSTGREFEAGFSYLQTIACFYVFCFIGNVFVGYFRGIGKVERPFLGTTLHISIRVILSFLLTPLWGLSAVAVATGVGWIAVVIFQGVAYKICGRKVFAKPFEL